MFEGKGATASRRDILRGIGGTVAAAAAGAGLSGTATAAGEPIAMQYFHEDWTTITDDLELYEELTN
jgi:alpha-amylase